MRIPEPKKGIVQRRLGGPEVEILEQGDCWATAVACFGGLTARDRNELHRRIVLSDLAVMRYRGRVDGGNWWYVTERFLEERGLLYLNVARAEWVREHPDQVFIASGPSPRGEFEHSVLAYGSGDLYWDPHPSGVGLPEIREWIGWWKP